MGSGKKIGGEEALEERGRDFNETSHVYGLNMRYIQYLHPDVHHPPPRIELHVPSAVYTHSI